MPRRGLPGCGRARTPGTCVIASTFQEARHSTPGDELLVTVAQRFRGRLWRSDLLARLGGDEFLVALPGLDPQHAAAEADRVVAVLAAAVRIPVALRGASIEVGASIGRAVSPDDGGNFETLLHTADQRMYAAKGSRVSGGLATATPVVGAGVEVVHGTLIRTTLDRAWAWTSRPPETAPGHQVTSTSQVRESRVFLPGDAG